MRWTATSPRGDGSDGDGAAGAAWPGGTTPTSSAAAAATATRGAVVAGRVLGVARGLMRGPRAGRPLVREQLLGPRDEAALVGVREPGGHVVQRHPGHLDHLDVGVGELAAVRLEQEVVHGLVHAALLGDEPEVDRAERREHAAADAGLLLDLADRGLLGGLAVLDVALGQRPDQAPAAVVPGDERRARDSAAAVDDQAAGAGLLDAGQPRRGRSGDRPPARGRRGAGGSGHTARITAPRARLGCPVVPTESSRPTPAGAAVQPAPVAPPCCARRGPALLRGGPRRRGARPAVRRGRARARPGRRPRARRLARPSRRRPRPDHRRPARARARDRRGLGRRRLGRRDRVRHRRGAQGRPQARDHDLPRRGLRPRVAQARGVLRRLARRRPRAARLHRERDGRAAAVVGARRPALRRGRPARRACCARPARPRTRSATTRCG